MKSVAVASLLILAVNYVHMNAFKLSSTSFASQASIPAEFTCDSINSSPNLSWAGAPKNTKSFALVCDDPDAPSEKPFVHWVIYAIPASIRGLEKKMAHSLQVDAGIQQGKNSFNKIGYDGPCPPPGKAHRYVFKLFALDKKLETNPGMTKEELLTLIDKHIIAQTSLVGLYQRK